MAAYPKRVVVRADLTSWKTSFPRRRESRSACSICYVGADFTNNLNDLLLQADLDSRFRGNDVFQEVTDMLQLAQSLRCKLFGTNAPFSCNQKIRTFSYFLL